MVTLTPALINTHAITAGMTVRAAGHDTVRWVAAATQTTTLIVKDINLLDRTLVVVVVVVACRIKTVVVSKLAVVIAIVVQDVVVDHAIIVTAKVATVMVLLFL